MQRNRYEIKNTRVLKLIDSCVTDMKSWGIPLPEHITWKSCKCDKRLGLATIGKNIITLSDFLFDEPKDNSIKSVIYHELAHLAAGPGEHHGPKWKAIANLITQESGIKVTRCADPREYEYFKTIQKDDKYRFRCTGCGVEVSYQKKSHFVKSYNKTFISASGERKYCWVCKYCKNHFEKI